MASRTATPILSRALARRVLLAAQGLSGAKPVEPGPDDVLAAIRRMHALQIDSISVVARSHYLVLWSRLGDYHSADLDRLHDSGAIFEHWSHAACYLDVALYPFYRRMMLERLAKSGDWRKNWSQSHGAEIEAVLQRVREAGPVRSADFERTDGRKSGGWWDWKVEKIALDLLFTRGDLMIAGRRNFQRIYDLRERVLPDWDDAQTPSFETARYELELETVRALGVARPEWVKQSLSDLRSLTLAMVRRDLAALEASGRLQSGQIEGSTAPVYVHPDNLAFLEQGEDGLALPATTFLSPFDPVMWDRGRALELFGFDYRIECYTPAPLRRYGYFTLPILRGDELVGRMDAKAHRRDGVFEVKALHLEAGVELTEALASDVGAALRDLARWHRTPEVIVRRTDPAVLAEALLPYI